MAHHHNQTDSRIHGPTNFLNPLNPRTSTSPMAIEDDTALEADEPPERHMQARDFSKKAPPPFDRKQSLLTQALVTSPELPPTEVSPAAPTTATLTRGMSVTSTRSNASAASTADLTSDGGFTSPARSRTPSPPLPPTNYVVPQELIPKSAAQVQPVISDTLDASTPLALPPPVMSTAEESAVEAGLGRKRCITFACGRKASPKPSASGAATPDVDLKKPETEPTAEPAKRPRALRFFCPSKDTENATPKASKARPTRPQSPSPTVLKLPSKALSSSRAHRDSQSTIRASSPAIKSQSPKVSRINSGSAHSNIDLDRAEATRFHEFASSVDEEDEWMNEASVHQKMLTVGDTLQKENVIRQLGEEAEEEALQDEEDEEEDPDHEDEQDDEDDEDDDEVDEEHLSDGGNETDDEEGFADSDEESDVGSEYNFWTPARSTAATSTDQLDHVRHFNKATVNSSTDATPDMSPTEATPSRSMSKSRKVPPRAKARSGTPELPDSTDFVCGTLDEDRPLEEAYVSCLEERKRSKRLAIPQDIDPSFPTSDPEDEEDDDNDNDGENDEHVWIKGQLDDCDQEDELAQGRKTNPAKKWRSPSQSPKRLHSPPPAKHGWPLRSPAPRGAGGESLRQLRSPPGPLQLKPLPLNALKASTKSPTKCVAINFAPLVDRPGVTRTKSLPRTPNPFSHHHAAKRNSTVTSVAPNKAGNADTHSRGAIDIVKGLEKKRQRRREKAWYKHCQQRAAKEKERKTQPGKGAERMRELGLEMAGKGKANGFGQLQPQYVLSI